MSLQDSSGKFTSVPVSVSTDSISNLLAAGLIAPPHNPGLLGEAEGYDLVRLLGRGGMGVVFEARKKETGEKVALKTLRPDLTDSAAARRRFITEARHLQKLRHTHVLPVFDVHEGKNAIFFTMPYYERGSLAEVLRGGLTLEREFVIKVAAAVASALSCAHSKGITHRDIKPANILLGGDDKIVLADFGLSRTFLSNESVEIDKDLCEGTPPYMSPAVARGEAEDTRCDIYALGALLYEMLTGAPPYAGATVEEVRKQILSQPPVPIPERSPKADPDLTLIAEAAMARLPRDRYSTMDDLLADIERVAAGKRPIGVRPGSYLLRKLPGTARRVARPIGVVGVVIILWALWPRTHFKTVATFADERLLFGQPAELGGGPGRELVTFDQEQKDLLRFNHDGEIHCQWPNWKEAPGTPHGFYVMDLDSDGRDEIIAGWVRTGDSNTVFGLTVLNDQLTQVGPSFEAMGVAPHGRVRGTAGVLEPLGVFTSSHDAKRKLLAQVNLYNRADTNDYSMSRSVLCFDMLTGKADWVFKSGPPLFGPLCVLNSAADGTNALVIGSSSVANGYKGEDGLWDTNSAVIAFSHDGRLLWKQVTPGEYNTFSVFRARNGTNRSGIYRLLHTNPCYHITNSTTRSFVEKLDVTGQIVTNYSAGNCFYSAVTWDLNQDGVDEILVIDCAGKVHVLDQDLAPKLTVQVFDPPLLQPGTVDHLQCGFLISSRDLHHSRNTLYGFACVLRQKEFKNPGKVVEPTDEYWYEPTQVLALNRSLKPEARLTINSESGPKLAAADMNGDAEDELLVFGKRLKIEKLVRR